MRIKDVVNDLTDRWQPAIETDGRVGDGAWVAEVTDLIDLSSWPPGTRLILRKERPQPGAQLTFTAATSRSVLTVGRCGVHVPIRLEDPKVPTAGAGPARGHRRPRGVDKPESVEGTGVSGAGTARQT